jgi:putative aminopeptidase FrvX
MLDIASLTFALAEGGTATGYEFRSRRNAEALLSPYYDSCETDAVGNLIFRRGCGRTGAPNILLTAHADEVGFYVSRIEDGGFLRLAGYGNVDTRVMWASEVWVYGSGCGGAGERIPGVVVSVPPHLSSAGSRSALPAVSELRVDTGYSRGELEKRVNIGDMVGFRAENGRLSGGKMIGKGFDDKICAAIIAAAVNELRGKALNADLTFLFAVEEEVNSLGARTGAYELDPDLCLVLDVTHGMAPGAVPTRCGYLGRGGVVSYSAVTDRALTERLIAFARAHGYKYQTVVEAASTGTDGNAINIANCGVPTAVISLPLRNMHTQSEVVDVSDAEEMARLTAAFIEEEANGRG